MIDCTFNIGTIKKFHELLSKEFTNVELTWYSDLVYKVAVVDPAESVSVIIRIDGKKAFVQTCNGGSVQTNIWLGVAKDKQSLFITKLGEAGFEITKPDATNSFLSVLGFSALMFFLYLVRPDVILIVLGVVAVLFCSLMLYRLSFKSRMLSNSILRITSSVFLIISLVFLSPSSLLLFPLLKYNSKSIMSMLLTKFGSQQ